MIAAWFRRRLAREQAKLVFQNSGATALLPFFARAGDHRTVVYLQIFEDEAKEAAALPKPLPHEMAGKLIENNREFRRYYSIASKAAGVTSSFDETFKPLQGWEALYRELGL